MTIVSASEGNVVASCTGLSVYTLLPPAGLRLQDLPTVPVSLTTHIYDRTGERLLYTLADEGRGSVPRYEWCSRPLEPAGTGSAGHLR